MKNLFKRISPEYYLFLGIIIILFFPFLLTCNAIFFGVDFSNTGQIGDTIGGITAPFLSLIGSILVYKALQAQIDANDIVQRQIKNESESQNLRELYQYIQNTIGNFEINVKERHIKGNGSDIIITMTGYNAFSHFWLHVAHLEFAGKKHQELNAILKIMITLRGKINNSKALNKDVIAELLDYQFHEVVMSGLSDYLNRENSYESYLHRNWGELEDPRGNKLINTLRRSIITYQNLIN